MSGSANVSRQRIPRRTLPLWHSLIQEVTPPSPRGSSQTEHAFGAPSLYALSAAAIFLLVGGYLAVRTWGSHRTRPLPEKIRVAVLPFQNLSGDPAQDYFSLGLTDELITQLGQLNPARVGVIASTSSGAFRNKSLSEIIQTLDLQYAIEGSVRRDANQVRIDVQLIEARDQTHVWANSYTRDLTDVLRVQSEVAEAVVRQIPANLHLATIAAAPAVDPEAHDAYLKARLYWNTRSDLGKSAALFQEAIDKDPNFAAAYAGFANVYEALGESPYDAIPAADAGRKSRSAAEHALALEPTNAEAHAALGTIAANFDWDFDRAEREYRRSLELNPSDPSVHEWLATVLLVERRYAEAQAEGQRSLDLDPVSPACHAVVAQTYYYAGDYDKAIDKARYILEVRPQFWIARYWLGSAYSEKKMYSQALEQFRLARESSGDNPAMTMGYAYTQAVSGDPAGARAVLQGLLQRNHQKHVPSLYLAGIYAGLNDPDNTMKYLNAAFDERANRLIYIGVEPIVAFLRSDPRFLDLLRRIGLIKYDAASSHALGFPPGHVVPVIHIHAEHRHRRRYDRRPRYQSQQPERFQPAQYSDEQKQLIQSRPISQ